jgi:DNA polymerase I-like protein with 3'-5' exonuclease and polymerase domains
MLLSFHQRNYDFRPWQPHLGRVFTGTFAFDCETKRIDDQHPWITPAYVLGAAFDGQRGYFLLREQVVAFFQIHHDLPVVFHSAPFDLAVLHTLAPELDVYTWVEQNRVWDTYLLHRLYVLGSEGHAANGTGKASLGHCADVYLKVELPKDAVDSRGQPVRLSYGRWLNQPPQQIEPVYLEYLARDVIATRQIYRALWKRLQGLLAGSSPVWGFVSPEWLKQQVQQWGPQTHHLQLRAAIVLQAITANGLHLDLDGKAGLAAGLQQQLEQQYAQLRQQGYLADGPGSQSSLQAQFKRLEAKHREVRFPRTANGCYATSQEALQDLAPTVPFVQLLLAYRATQKLFSAFVAKMARSVVHPAFDVLTRSGRTSSFGEINAQNLPTDDRVRSCFIPKRGHVFLDADYSTIELVTLAQACRTQFGFDSKMAEALNQGKDLHTLVAARVQGKAEADVTKEERKNAKPINFGKPGGMGNPALQHYAKASYGVSLSDTEVRELSDAWFGLFPEMQMFLADSDDMPQELATLLDLTLAGHYQHTGDGRFAQHPENAATMDQPSAILGGMLLKVVKEASPQTQGRRPYSEGDQDYLWSRLEAQAHLLAPMLQPDVTQRQPSIRLQRAVMALVGRAGVFTLTGRLRANATYSARHNTIFQGLAADGAKQALWLLWRAGYRIVNFVHDQVLVEVPAHEDLQAHADRVRQWMIAGMQRVVPDVRVEVQYAATNRWYKAAEAVRDVRGRLLLWEPTPKSRRMPLTPAPNACPAGGT